MSVPSRVYSLLKSCFGNFHQDRAFQTKISNRGEMMNGIFSLTVHAYESMFHLPYFLPDLNWPYNSASKPFGAQYEMEVLYGA